LDKDQKPELAIVFDTGKQTDMGTGRVLQVYKNTSGRWRLWFKSTSVVLPSEHGGVSGDPLDGIEIIRGCIVVYHVGGSQQKWSYTHKYRFQQNNWYLIGATINNGAPCDSFENYDYNLSTGMIVAKLTTEKCNDNDEPIKSKTDKFNFVVKPAKPILMQAFVPGETMVKVPGGNLEFYY